MMIMAVVLAGVVVAVVVVAVWTTQRRLSASKEENPHTIAPAIVPPGPMKRLRGDFNGVFGQLLCLSHDDYGLDESGKKVWLREGMAVQAWDENTDENGNPDKLIATGVVERPPRWLQRNGSRWVLRMDDRGVCHESEMRAAEPAAGADH